MMAAMMLPSTLPMVSLYQRSQSAATIGPLLFGYSFVWAGFSICLAGLQAWFSAYLYPPHPFLASAIVFSAGIYQFSPLKQACLKLCRTPWSYLLQHGAVGPFRLGLKHGLHCLGCCWLQMLIMLAVGMMNFSAMLVITLVILMEKWPTLDSKTVRMGAGWAYLAWAGSMLY